MEDICNVTIIHEDVINEVNKKLPSDEQLTELADFYKSFADLTRLKIIAALAEAEMCVCDLAYLVGISQSAISHQLRLLRQARLVKQRRAGKVIYYSLDDEHVNLVIKQGMSHINHR